MTRTEVLSILEKAGETVSYRYEHREEFREAMAVARYDIKAMQELVKIISGDLKGPEREEAIIDIIRAARRIAF